ncbi:MAG: hypothetical protein ACQES0_06500 [Bacteroidota bacterium]
MTRVSVNSCFYYLLFSLLFGISVFGMHACSDKSDVNMQNEQVAEHDIEKEDSVFSVLADYYNEKPDSAILLAANYEKQMIANDNQGGLIRLYSFLSELYQYRVRDDIKALQYINMAMDVLAEHPHIHFDNPFLYVNAGNILLKHEMYHEAIYVYKEIGSVMNLNTRPEVKTLISNNIGLAYQSLDMCDSSRHYYALALRQVDTTDSRSLLMKIQSYNHLGKLAFQCAYADSVPQYFRRTQELFDSINLNLDNLPFVDKQNQWKDISLDYISYRIGSNLNMANYYLGNQQPDSALTVLTQADPHFNPNQGNSMTHALMAEAYIQKNMLKKALHHIDTAIALSVGQAGEYKVLAEFYWLRADVLDEMGDQQKAISSNRMASTYNDSAKTGKSSHELMSGKIELAVKPIQVAMKKIEIRQNQKLKTVEMQLQLAEQKQKTSLYRWLAISGALSIALLILIFLLYRYKSRKRLAEVSLEASEKEKKFMTNELQDFSLHLVYRNDFLNELQRKLKAMVKDASDKNKQKIKDLHLQISQNLQSGHDAKMIEEKINEINSGFLFNLSEKYPHLTENDKNLCAMVRMNLSSKEIASIKNISERSVITARYRLRQKLDLSSEQNLNDFLKQV